MIGLILFTIYIVGFVLTLVVLYLSMEEGETVSVLELFLSLACASASWLGFLLVVLNCYGDKVVFTKK